MLPPIIPSNSTLYHSEQLDMLQSSLDPITFCLYMFIYRQCYVNYNLPTIITCEQMQKGTPLSIKQIVKSIERLIKKKIITYSLPDEKFQIVFLKEIDFFCAGGVYDFAE